MAPFLSRHWSAVAGRLFETITRLAKTGATKNPLCVFPHSQSSWNGKTALVDNNKLHSFLPIQEDKKEKGKTS